MVRNETGRRLRKGILLGKECNVNKGKVVWKVLTSSGDTEEVMQKGEVKHGEQREGK